MLQHVAVLLQWVAHYSAQLVLHYHFLSREVYLVLEFRFFSLQKSPKKSIW